jgi:hypothetical protein
MNSSRSIFTCGRWRRTGGLGADQAAGSAQQQTQEKGQNPQVLELANLPLGSGFHGELSQMFRKAQCAADGQKKFCSPAHASGRRAPAAARE